MNTNDSRLNDNNDHEMIYYNYKYLYKMSGNRKIVSTIQNKDFLVLDQKLL